jgi:hypothetical protein
MSDEKGGKRWLMDRRNFLMACGLSTAGLPLSDLIASKAHAMGKRPEAPPPIETLSNEYPVLNPQGVRETRDRIPLNPRLNNLKGKVVYFICQDKPAYTEELANRFRKRVPEAKTVYRMKPSWVASDDPELREEMNQNADALVYGTAMGGGSGKFAVNWIMKAEKDGIPSVYIVGEGLMPDVKASSEMYGIPSLRTVVTPLVGEDRIKEDMSDAKYDEIISGIIRALTDPLNEEEKKGGKMFTEKLPRITTSGTFEEVQDYFYNNGWTDGLPIIPPTEEKVKEMLRCTRHPPDEVVTRLMHPEELTVTVEKTAIVGVMAGCKPEYMPVLLAITETYGNPEFTHAARSESGFSIMTFVNGPIRNELNMNPSTNALSPGNQANASIGRFLSLAVISLGGSIPKVNNMSVFGTPTRYSFCFPEYEEESPWEPFHVSMGYKPQESVVSLSHGGWCHWGFMGDLDLIARAISGFYWSNGGGIVLMEPGAAKLYASKGMSKKDVETYIQKKTVPQLKDQSPTWFTFNQPEVPREDSDSSEDLGDPVKIIVVGGKTIMPNAQVWQLNPPIMTSVDKWR